MKLLEREQFFGELEAILSDVAGGNGRLVIVSGEAGIGKTSLVERFAEANKQQARVLWGACDALFTPRPLGPLYDIAHQTRGPPAARAASLAGPDRVPKRTRLALQTVKWRCSPL